MASKTSEKFKVNRGTAGGDSYYVTDVTTLADGSVKRETYRSDDKGNNKVLVQTVQVDKDGKLTKDEISSNASVEERRDLRNPKSQMRNGIKNSVNSVKDELVDNNIDGVTDSTIDKSANGSGNAALNEVQTGDNSQPSSVPPKEPKNRSQFGTFRYPLVNDNTADVIKFDMMKYEPKRFTENLSFSDRSSDRSIIGTVTLPIPAGIQDQNSCSWGPGNMDAVQAAASDFAKAAIVGGAAGARGSVGRITSGIKEGRKDVQKAITDLFAASASGINPNELLSRTEGVILNPNLELLFNAPSLRPFSFTFKMSPRSADEAKEIVQIIRFFKQGMAPIREGTRLFLKTPNTFKIQYVQLASNSASPFLNKFKECALTSCSVQYTPEGSYAPFEDGAMSSYSMTLAFQELEPVYSDDYEESDSSSSSNEVPAEIGF